MSCLADTLCSVLFTSYTETNSSKDPCFLWGKISAKASPKNHIEKFVFDIWLVSSNLVREFDHRFCSRPCILVLVILINIGVGWRIVDSLKYDIQCRVISYPFSHDIVVPYVDEEGASTHRHQLLLFRKVMIYIHYIVCALLLDAGHETLAHCLCCNTLFLEVEKSFTWARSVCSFQIGQNNKDCFEMSLNSSCKRWLWNFTLSDVDLKISIFWNPELSTKRHSTAAKAASLCLLGTKTES